jgi:hypothetical protein
VCVTLDVRMSEIKAIDYTPLVSRSRACLRVFLSSLRLRNGKIALCFMLVVTISLGALRADIFISVAPLLYLIYLITLTVLYRNNAWRMFAKANNWAVEPTGLREELLPPGLVMGHNQKIGPVIQAELEETICQLFAYSYETGGKYYHHTHNFTVALVRLPINLPHIQLNSKAVRSLRNDLIDTESLQLEGNFSNYFDLRLERGQQVDALSILSPEVMSALIDYDKTENIEIVDSDLFFITHGDGRNVEHMQTLIASVMGLSRPITRNIQLAHHHVTVEGT